MAVDPQSKGWSPEPVKGSIPVPILVVGLGNPILGDDGVGWRVADGVSARLEALPDERSGEAAESGAGQPPDVEIDWLSLGGLSLMERLVGYDQAILIDAMTTGQNPMGTIIRLPLSELPEWTAGHLSSAHDTSLQNALRLAQSMGVETPANITIVGIETDQVYDFTEELSLPILNAIPKAVELVMELLQ